jgi:hypothetical protein
MVDYRRLRITLALLCLAGCGSRIGPSLAPNAAPPSGGPDPQLADAGPATTADPGNPPGVLAQADNQTRPGAGPALQRQIIYDAVVRVIVSDFEGIPQRIEQLVRDAGGFVAHTRIQGQAGTPRRGEWKVRIPLGEYSGFLEATRALGQLQSLSSDSQDVTEQYYDLQSRIRNKQTEESRLLKHLQDSTGKLDEILAVEREVSRVREELERMQGRMRVLQDLTALATVTLHVDEIKNYVPPQTPAFTARVSRAFSDSWDALVVTGKSCIIAGAILLPWIGAVGIPLAVLIWVRRRLRLRAS